MEYKRVATCSDRIKITLSTRGMKQSELVKLTNIPKSAISQYISGTFEPKQDKIYLMAKALNVSAEWLMGLDVPMEKKAVTKKKENEKVKEKEYGLTDEEVEAEIARLNASEAVALARHEQRLKYRRRQYLYQLRDYEKKGKELIAAGMTREVLNGLYRNGNEND